MVEPNFKDKRECTGDRERCTADGCPLFGVLNAKGKVRGCGDPSARNGRNRSKGLTKQRKARKLLGVPDTKYRGALSNEETWSWRFRVEVKSGAQVGPIWTAYQRGELQSEAARSIGDPRAFVYVAMPDGMSDGLVVMRLSAWQAHIAPLLSEDF